MYWGFANFCNCVCANKICVFVYSVLIFSGNKIFARVNFSDKYFERALFPVKIGGKQKNGFAE